MDELDESPVRGSGAANQDTLPGVLLPVAEEPSSDSFSDFEEYFALEYPRAVATVAMVLDDRAWAEDCVQEALARAWERSRDGDTIDSLPRWTITVALNLARSRARRARYELRRRGLLDRRSVEEWTGASVEVVDLRRALAKLPRRQREVLVLHYLLDQSVELTARALQISETAVKNALFKGRRTLASKLGEDYSSNRSGVV